MENTPSSKDREDRREVLWETRIENIMKEWSSKANKKSIAHNKKGKQKKKLYYSLSIPCIIIPFFLSISNVYWEECSRENKLFNSVVTCVIGSLNGIQTLINYGSQYENHYQAESKYRDLHLDIECILVKHKEDRIPADICLERCRLLYENIERNSPDL